MLILLLPFTPSKRDNLAAWLTARCDGANYGKLRAYTFPRDRLIYGPKQVDARINQDSYISQQLTEVLFVDGLHLITQIRNNMKNVFMEMKDKIMLRKRSVIETINDELKNICSIEHSRHRSFGNFVTNLISGLIAYCFFPKKPAIKYEVIRTDQIALF